MTVYFFLIVIIFFLAPLCDKKYIFTSKPREGSKLYLKIIIILFIIVMGLRANSVGTDTAPYARSFAKIGAYSSYREALNGISNTAPVFILINWVCYRVTSNPQLYVFVMAVFINMALYFFVKKTSVNYFLSSFLYVGLTLFYYGMNGSRQTLAILLALNALLLLSDNIKSVCGWFLLLLAVGIHLTCLIMLVAVMGIILINKIDNKKMVVILFLFLGAVSTVLLSTIAMIVSKFFPHYLIYISGQASAQIHEASTKGRIVVVYLFLLLFIIIWLLKKNIIFCKLDHIFLNLMPMMAFGIVMGIVNCRNELINRLMWYFIASFITFIPYIISKIKRKYRLFFCSGIIIAFVLYNFVFLHENQSGVFPYLFFWN